MAGERRLNACCSAPVSLAAAGALASSFVATFAARSQTRAPTRRPAAPSQTGQSARGGAHR